MTDFGTLEIRAAWTEAFVKAQHSLINPPKTQRVNTGKFSYSYASLPDIIDSVRTVLAEQGLAVAQSVEAGASGYVGVTTTIYHSAGHSETFGPLLMPAGSTPQEAGSAITYARRYSLCAALNLAADEDDDGAKVSQRPAAAKVSVGKVGLTAAGQPSGVGDPGSGASSRRTAAASTAVDEPLDPRASSDGQAQEGIEGHKPPPAAPSEDVPTAGTSDTPPSQDGPEVPARGTSCLHLAGSETVKRSDGGQVEVCKTCRRVLEDVRS